MTAGAGQTRRNCGGSVLALMTGDGASETVDLVPVVPTVSASC
jgi:hypothetical protein